MSLRQKRRDTSARTPVVRVGLTTPLQKGCTCAPLSALGKLSEVSEQDGVLSGYEQCVPATETLNTRLRTLLQDLLSTTPMMSTLLVHIAQLEPPPLLSSEGALSFQRQYEHAPAGLHEQIFATARRVIRLSDRLCIEDEAGGAFVFPEVDRCGMETILERVYRSICLLQAETVVPPLKRETTILLGWGSFSAPGSSLELLLFHASRPARRLTLRPALFNQLEDTPSTLPSGIMHTLLREAGSLSRMASVVPFLDLPRELPSHLKQLLPYEVAVELRCVPVGRDQNRLTVAMANPHDVEVVQRLSEVTGMRIFPVACEIEDLDVVLTNKW
jgi:hypothetical protein